ncbi:sensor histidine kinase [Kamptonema formosum]|uniref:sensor histidine kinase n=1 Tax=Kamptonema formosum TaxID=331992 RepID=UPI00034BDCAF|nr:GAF domain-containing protein [Oscillatoria sp. PCC 10802]
MTGESKSQNAGDILTEGMLLNRMTNRIRQSLELHEILSATVAEVRSFLSTDRVKVYRFERDGSGQVIAESVYQNRLPSLQGLHFPATDIPPQIREMFVKARVRSIVDVPAQRITLSPSDTPETTGSLTLEDIRQRPIEEILQRPVDPCHIEYLTAMGVNSSLVVPILHGKELWGLLVSHHVQPKTFSASDLQIVQMVADQVSVAIAHSALLSSTRSQARREALINQISTLLHAPLNIQEILQGVLEKIVAAVGGAGGRLYLNPMETSSRPELYTTGKLLKLSGETGESEWLEYHPFWQQLMAIATLPVQGTGSWGEKSLDRSPKQAAAPVRAIDDLYQEPRLAQVAFAFQQTPIRGMLLMPLRYSQQSLGCLTLFRSEIDTDIFWAGRFDRDERNAKVRHSFEAWRELKYGCAHPWTEEEIELVEGAGTHLSMAVMQNRLYQWEREHRLLVEMRNQELQAARAAADEASRLKSDFLSSTSHELRTPLASTLNYLKLLKEGFYDSEEEFKEYVHIAHQSAENLVAIINDVLDIAKIEAGRMSVSQERVSLAPLLEEQRRLFNLDSRRKGILLAVECEVESVWADQVKLRQILTNLLSNAFKFTSAGAVRVRAVLRPGGEPAAPPPPLVEISVTDTGIGIDPSKTELLFEPFVQADGSIKRRYGGTGLGLTVCKRLVQLMGGKIWLESAGKGEGTTVTFTLPYRASPSDSDTLKAQGEISA